MNLITKYKNGKINNKQLNIILQSGKKQTIKEIPQGVVPYTLDKWGISEDQLPTLADESFTKGRMDNNIVDLTTDDVLGILKELYSE